MLAYLPGFAHSHDFAQTEAESTRAPGNTRMRGFYPDGPMDGNSIRNSLTCCALLLLLSACGAASDSQLAPAQPASPPEQKVENTPKNTREPMLEDAMKKKDHSSTASPNSANFKNVPNELLDRVRDAVEDEGAQRASITFERAEKVTWPDGSLGCPEPGLAYTQALVDGYWIVAHADGIEYDYRVAGNGGLSRCTRASKRPPVHYNDDT